MPIGVDEICPICFSNGFYDIETFDLKKNPSKSTVPWSLVLGDNYSNRPEKFYLCSNCYCYFSIYDARGTHKFLNKMKKGKVSKEHLEEYCLSVINDKSLDMDIRQVAVFFISNTEVLEKLKLSAHPSILDNVSIRLANLSGRKEKNIMGFSYYLTCPKCFIEAGYPIEMYESKKEKNTKSDLKTVHFSNMINTGGRFPYACKTCDEEYSYFELIGNALIFEQLQYQHVQPENFKNFCYNLGLKLFKSKESYDPISTPSSIKSQCSSVRFFITDEELLDKLKNERKRLRMLKK